MSYTWAALIAIAAAVTLDLAIARTRLLRRRAFWTAYAIVLGFQLLVNGLLTGLRIVRYDPARILGARLAYAPVEDLGFGFAMVTVTLTLWVWAGRAALSREPSARGGPPANRAGRGHRPPAGAAGPPGPAR